MEKMLAVISESRSELKPHAPRIITVKIPVDKIGALIGPGGKNIRALQDETGVKIDIEDFTYLEPGAILHWEFNHFVVFERLHKASITIVDPAGGRQVVPLEQVGRAFTGVALTLEPADTFQPTVGERGTVWRYLQPILSQRGLLSHIGVTPLLIQLFALALPVLTGLLVDRVVPQGDFHLLLLLSVGFLSMVLFTWLPLSAPISFCICAPTWTRA